MSGWNAVFEEKASQSVFFCAGCGSLLTIKAESNVLTCPLCGKTMSLTSLEGHEVVMHSQKIARVAAAQNNAPVGDADTLISAQDTSATVAEPCPGCNNPEMRFRTAQLRAADEGQTVFYECPKCGYKFSVNT